MYAKSGPTLDVPMNKPHWFWLSSLENTHQARVSWFIGIGITHLNRS